jgi:RNA polymerase sigma-70 factor (ECF subfamily)
MLVLSAPTGQKVTEKNSAIDKCIKRIGKGDKEAMEELYMLIKTDVFAFALSKTADRDLSEDLTHDTFVQIYKNAALYRSEGKPLSWVFTVEMNLIKRAHKLSARTVSIEDQIDDLSDETDFAENFVRGEFISELLSILSEEEREIITLHVVSGLKHREISSFLSIPLPTVLSKYHRALKKLNAKVKEGDE